MSHANSSATGLHRIWKALHYSRDGVCHALRNEEAFRLECLLALVLIPLALFSWANGLGKAVMIGSVLLVMIVELLNSAVEATVDRISMERHELAKYAKDAGSAAVLFSFINLVLVWGLVLFA